MSSNLEQIVTEFNSGKQGASTATKQLRDLYLSESSQSFAADLKAINERVELQKLGFPNSGEILGISTYHFLGMTWGTRLETTSADHSQVQQLNPNDGMAVSSTRKMTDLDRTQDQAIISQKSLDHKDSRSHRRGEVNRTSRTTRFSQEPSRSTGERARTSSAVTVSR